MDTTIHIVWNWSLTQIQSAQRHQFAIITTTPYGLQYDCSKYSTERSSSLLWWESDLMYIIYLSGTQSSIWYIDLLCKWWDRFYMFLVMTLRVNCYLIKLLLLTTMDKMKCLKRGIVTEPPQKWGVCLPRSYRGILDEARMRKHTHK
jgi:hypothetical protein